MGPLTPKQQADLDRERDQVFQEINDAALADRAAGETDTVVIMLVVPRRWRSTSEADVERLLGQQPHLLPFLAREVKRWQGSGVLDLAALRTLLEERGALDG
jgi:hypothetical protein